MNRLEIDLPRDLGIEQLQKILEVGLQNRFEELIVIHVLPMPLKVRDDKKGGMPLFERCFFRSGLGFLVRLLREPHPSERN
jgi:hypothetical protein